MFMPSGEIFLIVGATGEKVSVEICDLSSRKDFVEELKDLFNVKNKYHYDITKYIEAIYVRDGKTTMRIILDELYD